ncbi:hypothetical protein IC006_1413 [Sulfuracidifex tepidarius]|uniref:Uncharacterized protein n=1 Tax=Sulfuracidifex tepidarius TaxID=1294262 RepID=A0A510DV79_9CREN|nr:hypothetical protein IC006_1413 [Sulfuracidifex tepidarius]BBG26866.1 hypothetical protein IC007_1388 [Sulfuracidifex tepidarius]
MIKLPSLSNYLNSIRLGAEILPDISGDLQLTYNIIKAYLEIENN